MKISIKKLFNLSLFLIGNNNLSHEYDSLEARQWQK